MAILNTTTLEADARLVRTVNQPQDAGFKLFRGWPWITGYSDTGTDSIIDLITALNSTSSYTGPKANGRVYGGKFVVSENRAADETVDGRAARDCNIVQELTKVKTGLGSIGNLGTPDKNADKITLNFLGFQEGEQEHIYYKYTNLDPAERTNAMAVTLPTETGYTVVKREFITEKDKTGTLYAVYEKDTWFKSGSASWGVNKIRVGYQNYDNSAIAGRNTSGHGLGESHQLTGIKKGLQDTVFVAAQSGDTNRVVTNVRRTERANGEYAVTQKQRISYQGTAKDDALIVGYTDTLGSQIGAIRRVWFRRTAEAKAALADTATGNARVSDTIAGVVYQHSSADITDHGDGTYTVAQNMKALGSGYSAVDAYFTDSYPEVKMFTRSKDDEVKRVYYWKFVSVKTSESAASDFIKTTGANKGADPKGIVPGSDHIVKKAPFYYVATCKVHQKVSAVDANPKVDDWQAL